MPKIDNETLIEIALSSNEPIEMEPQDEVSAFIFENGLASGENKVLNQEIYDNYIKWTSKDKPLTKQKFFKSFVKYFERGKTGKGQRFYFLNITSFDTPGEETKGRGNEEKGNET